MLVSEIKTAVKRYGFDDTDPLLTWINAAYHEVEDEFPKWSFLEVTEVGSLEPAVPNDGRFFLNGLVKRMLRVRDVTLENTVSGDGEDLAFWDRRKLQRELRNLRSPGKPKIFTIIGGHELQVFPPPDSIRTIESTYIKELADLVLDTDKPDMPQNMHYLLVTGAAYRGLMAESEEDRAATAQNQFEADLGKKVLSDQIRQVGEPDYVVDERGYASAE